MMLRDNTYDVSNVSRSQDFVNFTVREREDQQKAGNNKRQEQYAKGNTDCHPVDAKNERRQDFRALFCQLKEGHHDSA